MTVSCPSCSTRFPVDPAKIPEGGVNARCSSCGTVFFVEKPAQLEETSTAGPTPDEVTAAPEDGPAGAEPQAREEPQPAEAPPAEAPHGGQPPAAEGPTREPTEARPETAGPSPGAAAEQIEERERRIRGFETTAWEGDDQRSPAEEAVREEEAGGPGGPASERPAAEEGWRREEWPRVEGRAEADVEPAREEVETPPESEPLVTGGFEGGGVAEPGAPPAEQEHGEAARSEGVGAPEAPAAPEAPGPGEPQEPGGGEPSADASPQREEREAGQAPETLSAPTEAPRGFQFGRRDPHEKARRLARVLVSDMIMYNPERHSRALEQGTLEADFEEEIRKSWEEYVTQVGDPLAHETSYFTDALNDILARGDPVFHGHPGD